MIGFDPLTAASLIILAGAAPSSICPATEPTKINVVPKTMEIKYDYSRTTAELQATQTDTIDPYGFHGMTQTQGFMQGQIKMQPRVELDYKYIPEYKAVCLWYKSIDITIEIDPTIVIAKEVYKDRCMKAAVIEHEMKHIKVDRQIVNKYAQAMGKKVYDGLASRGFKVGPIDGDYGQDTADKMQKVVYQIIEHEYQKMGLERTDLQRAVDNLQEYESVSAKCPDFHVDMPKPKKRKAY